MSLAQDYFRANEGTWGEYLNTPHWQEMLMVYSDKAQKAAAEAGFHSDTFGTFFIEFIATDFPRTTPMVVCTFLYRLATGCYKFFGAPNQMLICSQWREFIFECRDYTHTEYQAIMGKLSPEQVKTLRRPF